MSDHRALDGQTPHAAYHATPKALPAGTTTNSHFRIRLDHVDNGGKISLRRAGRMHHLGVSYTHRAQPVIVLIDDTTATVVHRTTGEVRLFGSQRGVGCVAGSEMGRRRLSLRCEPTSSKHLRRVRA